MALVERLRELSQRTHVQHCVVQEQEVLVYEDHRMLVNVLAFAQQQDIFRNGPPTLLCFDLHDDCAIPTACLPRLHDWRHHPPTPRDLWSFVEWELSGLDNDWLIAAFELGLIGNATMVGCQFTEHVESINGLYRDCMGCDHSVCIVNHLWECIPRNDFSWQFSNDAQSGNPSLVVDFDLDCFTQMTRAGPIPWTKSEFRRFGRRMPRDRVTVRQYLSELIRRSEFVTIARESTFCGGLAKSDLILQNIDEMFFSGGIRDYGLGTLLQDQPL